MLHQKAGDKGKVKIMQHFGLWGRKGILQEKKEEKDLIRQNFAVLMENGRDFGVSFCQWLRQRAVHVLANRSLF